MIQGRVLRAIAVLLIALFSSGYSQAKIADHFAGEYVVKLKDRMGMMSTQALGVILNAQVKEQISKASNSYLVERSVVEKPEAVLNELNALELVDYAEPNYIYRINARPDDPDLDKTWGIINEGQKDAAGQEGVDGIDVDAERAWDIETGSSEVIVAVIDTGIDPMIKDLAPNMWVNAAEKDGVAGEDDDGNGFVDDVYGYDFANNDGDPTDDHSHGSHCAGTIGAKGNEGYGISGVAWDVRLMAVKFLTASGSGSLANAVKSIDYATENGAHIMSNSWGGGGFGQAMYDAIERAKDKGILFVAAAGNSSSNNDSSPHYPSSYDNENVVAVAAIDNRGSLASFSSYGKTSVDIAAPGVKVYSTTPSGYKSYSGTSMATPHVSGVAALLLSADMSLSLDETKARLFDTARPLTGLRGKVVSNGMVSAYHALTNTMPEPDPNDPFSWDKSTRSISSAHPYSENTNQILEVKVDGATKVAVFFDRFETEARYDTLVFKDAEGTVYGTWSGNHNEEFSPVVSGDTMILEFTSDASVQRYGFDVTQVAYK